MDGEDPLAFPTFLLFDQETVTFTMTPIPEPAMLSLLATSGLALLRHLGGMDFMNDVDRMDPSPAWPVLHVHLVHYVHIIAESRP